jgi:hypothetical protein
MSGLNAWPDCVDAGAHICRIHSRRLGQSAQPASASGRSGRVKDRARRRLHASGVTATGAGRVRAPPGARRREVYVR